MSATQTKDLAQKQLFTFVCSEEGHIFGVVGDGYYKLDDKDEPIKNKVYRMILCPACGEFREICVVDRTLASINEQKKAKRTFSKKRTK